MCCFAGDTKIKLANGKNKAIKDIVKGDVVRGVKGKNTVTKVYKPFLHFRRKYSINNGEYFTTAEHPFMTTEGWKAIKPYRKWYDPECWDNYLHDHIDLKDIKPLWVGDKIITEKGQIEVKSITSTWNPLKWFERVYNISLDNDNTYYANGMLAHNKGGVGKIFKPIVNIFKKIVKAVTNIFTGFMGAFGMSFDTPDMGGGAAYDAESQGIKVNKQSNVEGLPIIYGQRLVGGTRVWAGTRGDDFSELYVCLAVAEGEIKGFKSIYIDDQKQSITSFPTNNNSTVSVVSGSKYFVDGSAKAQFQFFRGTEDQTVSSLLDEHDDWTPSHRLRGVAYVACKFTWVKPKFNEKTGDQTLFNPWRGIPTILVEVEGKKVLSGDYSGHGTTSSNTYNNDFESGFTYSQNPADCLLDYLRNPRYGKGLADNRIDWTAFRTAQQTCDTTVDFGGNLNSAKFLTCNTFLKPSDNIFQNTKKLLQTCRGFLPYTNGKYQLKIETAESTPGNLLELTDDKIIGKIQITSPDKNSKYNECHMTFSNSKKDFNSDTAIFTGSDAMKAEDNNETLTLTMGAPGITEKERALQYAEYMVKRSRKQLQLTLQATSEAQQLVAGDLVTITHSYNTQDATTTNDITGFMFKAPTSASYSAPNFIWRVTAQKLNYDGTVDLNLLEHQNDIYDVTTQQEDTDLSAIERHTPPGQEPPKEKPPKDPDDPTSKYFTIKTFIANINGVNSPGLSINNNDYQNEDARAVKIIYTIKSGNAVMTNPVDLPNPFGSGFTFFNGAPFTFGQKITLSITSEYSNGNKNFIEKHEITMPSNPNATASGGI